MSFDEWKRKVNQAIIKELGIDADDLPDCPYYDWYEQKIKPEKAAKKAIKRVTE